MNINEAIEGGFEGNFFHRVDFKTTICLNAVRAEFHSAFGIEVGAICTDYSVVFRINHCDIIEITGRTGSDNFRYPGSATVRCNKNCAAISYGD